MNHRRTPLLALGLALFALAAAACAQPQPASDATDNEAPGKDGPGALPVGCTEEAKVCPDGSSVARQLPNCEFAACPSADPVACTEEAKVCPDGSSVARQGPDCEFAPCPSEAPTD